MSGMNDIEYELWLKDQSKSSTAEMQAAGLCSPAPAGSVLVWTKNTPSKPGWYFVRRKKHVDVCRVSLFDIDNNTFRYSRSPKPEWAGPIKEPNSSLEQKETRK